MEPPGDGDVEKNSALAALDLGRATPLLVREGGLAALVAEEASIQSKAADSKAKSWSAPRTTTP
jgi:hypothetical protein